MAILISRYRPRKKRKQPAIVSAIVTPPKLKPIKGPVIRLGAENPSETDDFRAEKPKRSAVVEPKQKPNTTFPHLLEDMTPEEHQRRGKAADALWRELVRRAALPESD